MAKKIDAGELKKLAASDALIIGAERTLKELKRGTLSKVFFASNCSANVRESLQRYCGISKVSCEELPETDTEVGVLCKKQFSIGVVGVKKAK